MTYKGDDTFRSDGSQPSLIDVMLPELPKLPDAKCKNEDPDIWYDRDRQAEARAICRGCPERQACLDWAITTEARGGIWGGLDEDERKGKSALMTRRWLTPDQAEVISGVTADTWRKLARAKSVRARKRGHRWLIDADAVRAYLPESVHFQVRADAITRLGAKFCCRCRQWRGTEEFYRSPKSLDGLHSCCKACEREYQLGARPGRPGRAPYAEWPPGYGR